MWTEDFWLSLVYKELGKELSNANNGNNSYIKKLCSGLYGTTVIG